MSWVSEAAWAADRVDQDCSPGPIDPVHFADPADVPTGLPGMWLLRTPPKTPQFWEKSLNIIIIYKTTLGIVQKRRGKKEGYFSYFAGH
jgi:hypothetical protein